MHPRPPRIWTHKHAKDRGTSLPIITIRIRRRGSVPLRITSCPLAPSGKTAPEIPRDYSRGSVFTNHSVAADSFERSARSFRSLPPPPPPFSSNFSTTTSIDLPSRRLPHPLRPTLSPRSPPRRPTPPHSPRTPTCPLPRGARIHTRTWPGIPFAVGFDSLPACIQLANKLHPVVSFRVYRNARAHRDMSKSVGPHLPPLTNRHGQCCTRVTRV